MHCGMTVVILMVVTAVPPRPHATASPRSANSVAGAAASSTTLARSSCPASALWENGPLFGEFSLCLSRACLGKMFVFIHIIDDNAQKDRFLTCLCGAIVRKLPSAPLTIAVCPETLQEKRLFAQPFLRVSRACLGKSTVCSMELAQKDAFSRPLPSPGPP
jgi:hypothetical protein